MNQKLCNRNADKSNESTQDGLGALLDALVGPKILQLVKPRRAVAATSSALRDATRDESVIVTWTTRTVLAHPSSGDRSGKLNTLVSSPMGCCNTTLRMAAMFQSIIESYIQLDPEDWAPPIVHHGLSRAYLTCIAQRVAGALVLPVTTAGLSEQLSQSLGRDFSNLFADLRIGAKLELAEAADPRSLSKSPVALAVVLCLFLTVVSDVGLLRHFLGELHARAPDLLSTPVEPHVWNSIGSNLGSNFYVLEYPDPQKPGSQYVRPWEPKFDLTRPIRPTLVEVTAAMALVSFNHGVFGLVTEPRFGMDGHRLVQDFLNSRGPRHFQHARVRTQVVTAAGVKSIHKWLLARGWRDSDELTQGDGSTCQWFMNSYQHDVVLAVFEHFDAPFHKATKWESIGEVRQYVKEMFRDYGLPNRQLLDKFRKARLYGGRERSDFNDREWMSYAYGY
ncbi:hypothetical protein H9P43_009648 [Blastocladiella emersonii ATCC 22665]|nr:hypothetical protein H9P43_009648 [Blastocladiella emersonii ATCC 22665]